VDEDEGFADTSCGAMSESWHERILRCRWSVAGLAVVVAGSMAQRLGRSPGERPDAASDTGGMRHPARLRVAAATAVIVVMFAVVACGDDADETPATTATTVEDGMELTSRAFEHEGTIPQRYTCDGEDVSPPLTLTGIPQAAAGLVLIMDDPDAPGRTWDHWVAYDIPVGAEIPEAVGALGTAGTNSWNRTGYGGPCPPGGTHRYFFRVYALDTSLDLAEGATKDAVTDAMSGHVLAEATLMGRYTR
jgi:Raf kinase inhibitor-like YbhB/YbcL family protein